MVMDWLGKLRQRPGKALYDATARLGFSGAVMYQYQFSCDSPTSVSTLPSAITLSVTTVSQFDGSLGFEHVESELTPDDTVIVARDGSKIVGTVVLSTTRSVFVDVLDSTVATDPSTAYLWALFVEPSHRGRGIGRALVERSLDVTCDLDMRSVLVLVAIDNGPSRGLFDGLGPTESALIVYGRCGRFARQFRR